jgi:formylglycine-generating enzyme
MTRTIAVAVAAVLCVLLLPAGSPADTGMLRLHYSTLCALRSGPDYQEGTWARADLEEKIAAVEHDLMMACWDEAAAAFDAGDFGTSIARLDEVLEWGTPGDMESYYLVLGHAHYHYAMTHGRDPEHLGMAVDAYRSARAYCESGDAMYRVNEARALAALGREADARSALDHDPGYSEGDSDYWMCRAEAFSLLGDTAEESACLEHAQGLDAGTFVPSSPETPPAQLAPAEPAFSASEVEATEVYLEGDAAFNRGDYAAAAELFRQSLNIYDDVWVWTMLGQCYEKLGDAQEAENCYARVEGREPETVAPSRTPHAASRADAGLTYLHRNRQGCDVYESAVDHQWMIMIPAGEFTMGADEWPAQPDQGPARTVYVSEFLIDRTEVTNGMYREFCDQTGHPYPADAGFSDMPDYFTDYPDYPVVRVRWDDARAYAEWAGKRLPTEAEWEKAARGADGRTYPWGEQSPDADGSYRANWAVGTDEATLGQDGYQFTAPAGVNPDCESPCGMLDMAGNVSEWCADWYDATCYAGSTGSDPDGPASGEERVVRGGSWRLGVMQMRCAWRDRNYPNTATNYVGFRCAVSGE